MQISKTGIHLYRNLYWVNQAMLHAVRALQEAEFPAAFQTGSGELKDKLRRTQAMIEETRVVMNRDLGEWLNLTTDDTDGIG